MIDYSALVKEIRSAKGLTQEEFAKECGVTQASINKIETGANKSLDIKTVANMVTNLDVNPYGFIFPGEPLFLKFKRNDLKAIKDMLKKVKKISDELAEVIKNG